MMVEGIEGIHFEEESNAFGNAEFLADRSIKVVDARCPQEVTRGVSKRAEGWLGKTIWVEARELPSEIAMNIAAFHYIRVHELAVINALDVVRCDRYWEAALEGDDAAELPASDCDVCSSVDLIRIFLAATNG